MGNKCERKKLDRSEGNKIKIIYDYGLPFVEIELLNGDKSIMISKALIDTGSATTIIPTETAIYLEQLRG
jgi:hypothetical protein